MHSTNLFQMDTCRRGREETVQGALLRENRDFLQGRVRHISTPPTLVSRPGPSHVFVFTLEPKNANPHRKPSQGVALGCIG